MKVPAAGSDRKFVVFGRMDYATGQVIWRMNAAKNSKAFLAFMKQLQQAFPKDKLVVVLDNVGYHKSLVCRRWWEQHQGQITPLWLPVYAPQLNLMERVWGFLKDRLSCHRWWANQNDLQQMTKRILDRLKVCFACPNTPSLSLEQNF